MKIHNHLHFDETLKDVKYLTTWKINKLIGLYKCFKHTDWLIQNLRYNLKIHVLQILIQFGICCCSKAMLKCPLHGTGISRVLYKKITHDSLLLALGVVQGKDEDWYYLTPVSSLEMPEWVWIQYRTLFRTGSSRFFFSIWSRSLSHGCVWYQSNRGLKSEFSFSSVYQIIWEYID